MNETKKIVVTGASGLVGSALLPMLKAEGHSVTRLVRSQQPDDNSIKWHPESGFVDHAALEGHDAVIHLAGEPVAQRWTPATKERIRASRVDTTRLLCGAAAGLSAPPKTLICASATGYYGDRGDEVLPDDSAAGAGFLPELCRAWEAATEPAQACGIRVVHLRFGILLSPKGGALASMLRPFRLGLGGRVGSGQQYWSWMTLDDAVGAICHVLNTSTLHGAVNVVSPHPVRNQEFTQVLARVLRRPAIFPVPAFAIRLLMGQGVADELLLASARVQPAQLQASGYCFRHPELESALYDLLNMKHGMQNQ
ncbi:MAG TPA: TIGR01777 family oxidoreductase [Abditibacteriaceae bacterium]|jgi:hypothetical protein